MALIRVLLQSTYDSNNFCECISHTQKPFKLKKQIKISFINERLAETYLLLFQKKCNHLHLKYGSRLYLLVADIIDHRHS
jgi:hypothetical protein